MLRDSKIVRIGLPCIMEDHDIELEKCTTENCECRCHLNIVTDGGAWRGVSKNEWVTRIMGGAGLLPRDDWNTVS